MKKIFILLITVAFVFTLSTSSSSQETVDTFQPTTTETQSYYRSNTPTDCEGLAIISDRTTFNTLGAIVYNYGFEDFGTGFSYPGNNWTKDGITYTSGQNIVVGTATSYRPLSNVMTHNQWTPVTGTVQISPSTFDMFAFDLAYIGRNDPIDLTIYTNLATYHCYDLTLPIASVAQDFYGFVSNSNAEYFMGYRLSSNGTGSAPVIDNVTLGHFVWIKEVQIDIKPGSDPNCFNQNEHGALPVAIFGSAEVDVNTIVPESLSLQGLAGKVAGKSSKYLVHYEYVNDDMYLDLIVQFADSDGWVDSGDGYATVTGQLYDGTPIEGMDSICIVR